MTTSNDHRVTAEEWVKKAEALYAQLEALEVIERAKFSHLVFKAELCTEIAQVHATLSRR